jgi:tRNA guanosine-2'-O-methyltransferase
LPTDIAILHARQGEQCPAGMDTDTILGLLDEKARVQAFEACLKKLESAPRLDFEVLRVCVKLHPPLNIASGDDSRTTPSQDQDDINASTRTVDGSALNQRLCSLLTARIPHEPLDSDHFYELAEILCSDGPFANLIFRGNIHVALVALLPKISDREPTLEEEFEAGRKATAYLTLLKCSYWLPSSRNHAIDPGSLRFLAQFAGLQSVEHVIYDAISAFLSLLRREERIIVAPPADLSQSWLKLDPVSGQVEMSGSVIDGSLWDRLRWQTYKQQVIGELNEFAVQYLLV